MPTPDPIRNTRPVLPPLTDERAWVVAYLTLTGVPVAHEVSPLNALYRSAALLWRNLTPTQRADLVNPQKLGFSFKTPDNNEFWIDWNGKVRGTVQRPLPGVKGKMVFDRVQFCIDPADVKLPLADLILAHKWWLEADEVGWRLIARH